MHRHDTKFSGAAGEASPAVVFANPLEAGRKN
jgi:hypothetical protein